MSDAQLKILADYVSLLNQNAKNHVIRTANRLNVLDTLRGGQKSAAELSDELSLDLEALKLFMEVLCQTELVDQYEDDYALSAVGKLIPPDMMGLGDQYWARMEQFIRSGKSLANDADAPDTQADYLQSAAAQEWMCTPAALDMAMVLDIGAQRKGLRILEVGCSTGVFGLTLLHQDASASITFLDDALGLARARETVESLGLNERVTFAEGDYLKPELESEPFDLVLATGILHRHSSETCRGLFKQLHDCLRTGGELAIVDMFPGRDAGDTFRLINALQIQLRTIEGQLHSPKEIQAALKENGFAGVQYAHLPSPPKIWGLFIAKKEKAAG